MLVHRAAVAPGLAGQYVGVEPDEIAMPVVVAGINHCASVIELRLKDGRDGLALARERVEEPVVKWVLETYGVLPYCWQHWVEFHPQMQYARRALQRPRAGTRESATGSRPTTWTTNGAGEAVRGSRRGLDQPDAGPVTLDDLPPGDEDEGIEVIQIMEAIVDNRNETHIVNARQQRHDPEPARRRDRRGQRLGQRLRRAPDLRRPAARAAGRAPAPLRALQKQMVKAALSGDRQDALHAFLLEPTIAARLDLDQTEAMLDELLAAHADYLPQFAGR